MANLESQQNTSHENSDIDHTRPDTFAKSTDQNDKSFETQHEFNLSSCDPNYIFRFLSDVSLEDVPNNDTKDDCNLEVNNYEGFDLPEIRFEVKDNNGEQIPSTPAGSGLESCVVTPRTGSSSGTMDGEGRVMGERRRGKQWSVDEHKLFILGLKKYGKGDWKSISRNYVITRSSTQVASHAQKYFKRRELAVKRKRSSIHDIIDVDDDAIVDLVQRKVLHSREATTILQPKTRVVEQYDHHVVQQVHHHSVPLPHQIDETSVARFMSQRDQSFATTNVCPNHPYPPAQMWDAFYQVPPSKPLGKVYRSYGYNSCSSHHLP